MIQRVESPFGHQARAGSRSYDQIRARVRSGKINRMKASSVAKRSSRQKSCSSCGRRRGFRCRSPGRELRKLNANRLHAPGQRNTNTMRHRLAQRSRRSFQLTNSDERESDVRQAAQYHRFSSAGRARRFVVPSMPVVSKRSFRTCRKKRVRSQQKHGLL